MVFKDLSYLELWIHFVLWSGTFCAILVEDMVGFNLTIILLPLLILFSSMYFKYKIIQWNGRGLKPNYNEVSLLIAEYNPSVFCFQETFLKPDDSISFKGFYYIYNYVHTDCLRPCGGASIFVKPSFLQIKLIYNQNYKQLLFLSL